MGQANYEKKSIIFAKPLITPKNKIIAPKKLKIKINPGNASFIIEYIKNGNI